MQNAGDDGQYILTLFRGRIKVTLTDHCVTFAIEYCDDSRSFNRSFSVQISEGTFFVLFLASGDTAVKIWGIPYVSL